MGNYWTKDSAIPKFGYIKDKIDSRDLFHNFKVHPFLDNFKKVDLRDSMPPIYDQGSLGSCTANGIAAAYEYDMMKQGENNIFCPSRLFIYYNERDMEGTINEDSGAQIRDGIKSINKIGVCKEDDWPYDISKFKEQPDQNCYEFAKDHHSVEYKRVINTIPQIKQCLLNGFPIVFGFVVFESFMKITDSGIMQLPNPDVEQELGGHCVVACGFETIGDTEYIICRNSWNTTFGDKGYFYMPCEFIKNPKYCSDFWTVTKVYDK